MFNEIKRNCLIHKRKKDQNNLMIKQQNLEPRFRKVDLKEKDFKNNLKKKERKENSLSKA